MRRERYTDRRKVLKTIGGGVVGAAAFTGAASADENDDDDQPYEGGTDLDGFLNEEAVFKETPIWEGEIVDKRGQDIVDVDVGSLTSVDPPEGMEAPPFGLPVGFAPRVVRISPGATVRWTWVSNPYELPIPHDVTSLVNDDGNVVLERHADQRYHHHARYTPVDDGEDVNPTFEFTFEDRGNHPYYCTPHGAPFEVCHEGDCLDNAFGMRGAVQVAGKSLEGSRGHPRR